MCVCLTVCTYTICVQEPMEIRILTPLELELNVVVSHCVGAGNKNPGPLRAGRTLNYHAISPALKCVLFW